LVESRLTEVAQEIADGYIEAELPRQYKKFSEAWEAFWIYVTDYQNEDSAEPCEVHFWSLCGMARRKLDWEILATS